jgi:GH25 family lysozyme M1 (1,4-beta-N-acetylmuramidase)
MVFDDRGIVGADIAYYEANPLQGQYMNFQKMKNYGVSFVIIKAGQWNFADPAFRVNRIAARDAGIPRAFYWFLDYRGKGKDQAQKFWSLISDDPGEGPLIVDFELGSGNWRILWDFIVELQVLSKYTADRIWIYTGYYYWKDFGPQTAAERRAFIP